MRFLVLIVVLSCCTTNANAGQWLSVEAQAVASAGVGPALMVSPELTVKQYNERMDERETEQFRLVAVTITASQLSPKKLVDRPIEFHTDGHVFHGRVSSVFIDSADSAGGRLHVLAWVENRRAAGNWHLGNLTPGKLVFRAN